MVKKKIIGEILIDNNIKYIYLIDDSKLLKFGVIKIQYIDNEGRKTTKFVTPDKIKKY